MVPLQALLTLGGNVGCAVAAYRIVREGERADRETWSDRGVYARGRETSSTSFVAGSSLLGARPTLLATRYGCRCVDPGRKPVLKYGELAVGISSEPNYAKALAVVAVPTAAWTATLVRDAPRRGRRFLDGESQILRKGGDVGVRPRRVGVLGAGASGGDRVVPRRGGDMVGSERSGG